jgi:hypothetical protein
MRLSAKMIGTHHLSRAAGCSLVAMLRPPTRTSAPTLPPPVATVRSHSAIPTPGGCSAALRRPLTRPLMQQQPVRAQSQQAPLLLRRSVAGVSSRAAPVAWERICAVTEPTSSRASQAHATGARPISPPAISMSETATARYRSRRPPIPMLPKRMPTTDSAAGVVAATRVVVAPTETSIATSIETPTGIATATSADGGQRATRTAGTTLISMAIGMVAGRLAHGIPPGRRTMSRWSHILRILGAVVSVSGATSRPDAKSAIWWVTCAMRLMTMRSPSR